MPSRYEAPVDRDAANNAHAFMLQMVGWNRRVLELGAASGHVTRALVEQNCTVTAIEYDPEAARDLKDAAQEVIVGDLNDPEVFAGLPGGYDVVLAGDVLEHLLFPQQVLNRIADQLAPHGHVVVSLPHVAHVDMRLALLQGRFDYNAYGLLDDTHIRFFTIKTIKEMVKKAGLVITDLRRVRIPAFETELGVDRATVSTAVLDVALADPEAETYQYVFTAVRDNGDYQLSRMAEQNVELQSQVSRLLIARQVADIAASESEDVAHELQIERARREHLESELRAITGTKTFRYIAPLRRMYGRLRGLAR